MDSKTSALPGENTDAVNVLYVFLEYQEDCTVREKFF